LAGRKAPATCVFIICRRAGRLRGGFDFGAGALILESFDAVFERRITCPRPSPRGCRCGGVSCTGAIMETIRPRTTDPIPLRQSPQRMGTIMVRFVGLLLIAITALALLWSR
jgi:hypothetical protein